MRFDASKDFVTGAMDFHLRIYPADYERARLDCFDRAIVAAGETGVSIADALLALEVIARRIEEAHDAAA